MIAQTIRAVLLASATAATFGVRRASSWISHGRRVPLRTGIANNCQRADDQHLLQVPIALLGDTAKALLSAAGVLFRDQPDPSG